VRYEYAQTAIDVLARRTRLSFLDAQGALDALPRVVEIMAEELGWTRGQKKQQIENAMLFLSSMGLAPDAGTAVAVPDPAMKGLLERALWRVGGGGWFWPWAYKTRSSVEYSRARFEAGEVEELRRVFMKRAAQVTVGEEVAEEERIKKVDLVEVLKEVPGYEDVAMKDCEYVLEEAGFSSRKDVNFDEFVEVFFYSFDFVGCYLMTRCRSAEH
jgi:glycerol-3-phosphate dehydrogenase